MSLFNKSGLPEAAVQKHGGFDYGVSPSPARFLSAAADVGDCEYISGSAAGILLKRVFRHIAQGEVIAPVRAGSGGPVGGLPTVDTW